MSYSLDEFINRATCAVLINGKVKGTAWLVNEDGYLLTAGHVIGTTAPTTGKIEVLFSEDILREVHKIQWDYHPETGCDFAVLKLTSQSSNIHHLPISLTREVTGTFKSCGYGVTLKDKSEGMGEFVGLTDPQNFPGNRLWLLRSPEIGESGYSGSAIFSLEKQAVVAIQVESTIATTGAGRDTTLAMPLYRIAQRWELLTQISRDTTSEYSLGLSPIFDTTVARSNYFVGRTKEMEELAKNIQASTDQNAPVTVFYGMAGVGKTGLVIEFAYKFSYLFPGGILWADFPSNQGNPLPILSSWAQLCGRRDLLDIPSMDIRAQAVRRALKEHIGKHGKMLAIFDDVRNSKEDAWLEGAHLLHKAIPNDITLIVTTRQNSVAASFRVNPFSLDPLLPTDAILLIEKLVPNIIPALAKELADLTGNLPLAIEISSALANIDGLDWLIESLRNPETRIDTLKIESTSKEDSVHLSFSLSYQSLSSNSAELFQTLGIFAQGYISPEWVVNLFKFNKTSTTFKDPKFVNEHLRDLANRSLIQRTKTGYRFHPLLQNYANLLLRTSGVYENIAIAHMKYFLSLSEKTDASLKNVDLALENIVQASDYAYKNNYFSEVIKFAQSLALVSKFLHTYGYWQIAITLLGKAVEASETLDQPDIQVKFLCEIGIHQRESGQFALAESIFQEAMSIAQKVRNDWLLADLYFNAGYLLIYQSHYEEATTLLQKAMDVAQSSGNNNALGEAFRGVGRIKLSQGELDSAESYLQRSKSILEVVNNQQGLAYCLRSLGEVFAERKQYDQSLNYFNRGLLVAEEIGDKQAIAYIQRGLGDTYVMQGNNNDATKAYLKSEKLYRDIGDRAALSAALCSIGEVYLLLFDAQNALSSFKESYSIASKVNVTRWLARSLFGLARVQEMKGDKAEAITIGKQALQILESVRHRDRAMIQDWLKRVSDSGNVPF